MPEKIKKQKIILDLRKSDERQVFCILEILQNVVQIIIKIFWQPVAWQLEQLAGYFLDVILLPVPKDVLTYL